MGFHDLGGAGRKGGVAEKKWF